MKTIISILMFLIIASCSSDDTKMESSQESEWLVDPMEVTGEFSLFPLAINPEFTAVSNIGLDDNELVGVMVFGSTIRVYPYLYTYENEIINDEFNGLKYAISYCPITKSAVAFTRDQVFRASGYLYKDNITPWDEKTESIWSQMLIKGIKGPKKNVSFNTIPVLETRWKTIKDYYPNAKIMVNHSFSRSSQPPDDPGDDNEGDNDGIPELGEWSYGIIDRGSDVYVFRYRDFSNSKKKEVIVGSQKYIVYGNASKRVINAFKVSSFDNFELLEDSEFPFVLEDTNGVKYDVLGKGTNGATLGKPKFAYVAIWRAWDDFYNNFMFEGL